MKETVGPLESNLPDVGERGGTTAVPISAILVTLNAMPLVERCLESLGWADEIVAVDGGSEDGTEETLGWYTDWVYHGPAEAYRQNSELAAAKARNRWVFWIDGDEEVSPELLASIRSLTPGDFERYAGFTVPRRTRFLGRWIGHSGWYPDRNLRLFDRERGRFSQGSRIHPRILPNGPVRDLEGDLLHRHEGGLREYLVRMERYSRLEAEDRWHRGARCKPWTLIPRAAFTFFRMYVLQRGFLDGVQGLVLAGLSAAHTFTKYARLWELQQQQSQEEP